MNLSRSVTLVQFKGSTATDRSSQGKDARAEQQAKLMHGFLLQKNPARLPAWSTRQNGLLRRIHTRPGTDWLASVLNVQTLTKWCYESITSLCSSLSRLLLSSWK